MQRPSVEQAHEESATHDSPVPSASSSALELAAPLASLPSLPVECLQLILAHHDGDLTTLHSLLLVNRTFFQLAVPLLYRSPFRLVRSYEHDKLPWDKFKRQVKLLWLLLCSVIHHPWVRDELPPFSAEFPVLHNPSRTRPCSDEDDRQGLQEGSSTAARGWPASRSVGAMTLDRDLTIDYLRYYTHHDHTTLSDAFPTLFPSLICYHMDQWSRSEDMIRIRNTVERALLLHHSEGIVSLAIPITRIHLFLEAVPRLFRLRRIELHDIKLEFRAKDAIEFVSRHDQLMSGHQRRRGHRGSVILGQGSIVQTNVASGASDPETGDTAIEPVDMPDHSLVSLTEVKIGGPGDYGIIEKPDLYRILQAMSQPKVIDLTGWRGAVLDLAQVPVHSLETLLMRLDRPLPRTCPIETFLQKARNLKELQICISPAHGGLFRWAVALRDEKNKIAHRKLEQETANLPLTQEREKHWPGVNEKHEEDGLKALSLAGETAATVWALTGATEAFSTTLEVLKANSWKRPVGIPLDDNEDGNITNEPFYLYGAPDLENANGNSDADMDTPTPHPHHPHHPHNPHNPHHSYMHTSLHAPRLTLVSLMIRLQELDLKGEIAAIAFDFRSLARCPQLRVLRLNTHPCGIAPHPERIQSLLQHVSASVQELDLTGPWFITDWHLDRMATVALPDLRRLRLVHCKTFSDMDAQNPDEMQRTNVQATTMMRTTLPPHLVDALPAQQDIVFASAACSPLSSTSTSSSFSLKEAAAIPSNSPSAQYLTGPGLVHAVERMKELRDIRLGLDLGRRDPHQQPQGQGQGQGDRQQRSPYEELMAAQAAAAAARGRGSGNSNSSDASYHGVRGNDTKEEGELASMARALQHHSENRILPLMIEIQHCSL
ncbi:hypothetical protein BGZ72_001819 [Mortierella alpina]|nr:hypothetical protein BGZ72_001819 [Mortierella alpina]